MPLVFSRRANASQLAGTMHGHSSLIWNDLFQVNNVDFYWSFSFIFYLYKNALMQASSTVHQSDILRLVLKTRARTDMLRQELC